ncbi:MAG: thiamine phosphate synthase [Chitinophagaceae bacterium]|nr:MAG: thiamine phosphate synthase [Chitinophagaceae bacterium]
MNRRKITGGVYLIVDPAIPTKKLLHKLASALDGGVSIVQIWNNWPADVNKDQLITDIAFLSHQHDIPVLINEDWNLLFTHPELDGIHLDEIPPDYYLNVQLTGRDIITGITCGNDFKKIIWAIADKLDYLSFCSMFPSSSAGSCEIVMPSVIEKTRLLTDQPIFIAGGLTPENVVMLSGTITFDGVAVVSGIMDADSPGSSARDYLLALSQIKSAHETPDY